MAASKGDFVLKFDTVRFTRDMKQFERLTEKRLEKLTGGVAEKAFQSVRKLTPVGATGDARRSWRKTRRGAFKWLIFSDLPYIRRLEHGWSKQAGRGFMVRRTRKLMSLLI